MVMTRRKPRVTYRQVLENAKTLRPVDQRRLQIELSKSSPVYVMRPTGSPAAIRRGRRLAAQIRKQMNTGTTGTLEETMRQLRGRSWS